MTIWDHSGVITKRIRLLTKGILDQTRPFFLCELRRPRNNKCISKEKRKHDPFFFNLFWTKKKETLLVEGNINRPFCLFQSARFLITVEVTNNYMQ